MSVDAAPALEPAYGDRVPLLIAGDPGSGVELRRFRLGRERARAAAGARAAR